jgi:hypothetical protein
VNRVDLSMSGGSGMVQLSFGAAGGAGASAAEADKDEEEDTSAQTLTKRAHFCMSDAELARACTIMNLPAAQATSEFLKDKPLDVRLYTPRLIELYTTVRQTNEAISRHPHGPHRWTVHLRNHQSSTGAETCLANMQKVSTLPPRAQLV